MITIREMRTEEDIAAIVLLGKANRDECSSHLPYLPYRVEDECRKVINDSARVSSNVWIAWKDEQPVGYGFGYCTPFMFNTEISAVLHLFYVVKEWRHSWAAVKIVKHFEKWARSNNAVQLSLGVERLDEDQAKHIRSLFPKLKYRWAGSFYIKETI